MKEIKEKLEQMQQAIVDELARDRDRSTSAVSGDIGDTIDYANEDRLRELYQLLCERDENRLKQIRHALESIDANSYGVCDECGDDIGRKRLMALPFTKLCIECKSEEERTKGASSGSDTTMKSFSGSNSGEL